MRVLSVPTKQADRHSLIVFLVSAAGWQFSVFFNKTGTQPYLYISAFVVSILQEINNTVYLGVNSIHRKGPKQ